MSAEEAYYDFRIVGEDEEKLSLSILAARTEVIDPYINALRDKGVTVSAIAVSLAGVGTLCHFMDRKTDTLYIEMNERGYDGTLFSKGSIISSFSAQFSSDDETSQARQLGADLMRLAHKDDDRGEPKVILHMKRKSQTLRELVRLETNMNVLMIDEVDLRLAMKEPQSNVPYAAVAGVLDALWPAVKQGRLNLLTKGRHEEVRTPKVLTLILCLVIIAAAVYYMISPIQIEEKRLKELDRQIALRKGDVKKVESLKKEIESVKKEIAVIENFKKNRPMTMTIVKEITSVLPKTAWLTRLRITETTVEIEGYSNSATEILSKLEASKHLRKAEFASPTFRDVRMNAERFIIKMELEGVKKEEGEKPKSGPKK
ncbi:MAG: PilN domain-containing protein [Desulfobacterales bacterium]|nr:PilN domain-containing protein [Desulfobacterales bacterium]